MSNNQGYAPEEISKLKAQLSESGKSYVVVESEDNSDV